jgi:cytochrome c-type biogenesis protein CcmH
MKKPQALASLLRRPSSIAAALILLVVAAVWGVTVVRAAQPKSLDQRTYEVASQLQCPVCHGESVADSSSPIAQTMRDLISQKLAAGESEQQVVQEFHLRYGDTILESPPMQGFTLLIWLGPIVMLLAGLVLLRAVAREWHAPQPAGMAGGGGGGGVADGDAGEDAELSDAERTRYLALLRQEIEVEEGGARW